MQRAHSWDAVFRPQQKRVHDSGTRHAESCAGGRGKVRDVTEAAKRDTHQALRLVRKISEPLDMVHERHHR